MKYFKKLVGKRIYLSPINKDDIQQYVKWMNDFRVTDGTGCSGSLLTLEGEKQWLESVEGAYQFAVVTLDGDRLIGNCGFQEYNSLHQTGEVGLFIGEEKDRGCGYGKEILQLLLEYGFEYLNLHNIMLKLYSFNTPALRCYQKTGFKEIGRRRECYYLHGKFHDHIYMDILKSEWEEMQKHSAD